jgi:hypothetical protein
MWGSIGQKHENGETPATRYAGGTPLPPGLDDLRRECDKMKGSIRYVYKPRAEAQCISKAVGCGMIDQYGAKDVGASIYARAHTHKNTDTNTQIQTQTQKQIHSPTCALERMWMLVLSFPRTSKEKCMHPFLGLGFRHIRGKVHASVFGFRV